MESYSILVAIIGLITLIMFFALCINVGNIRKNIQYMQRIIDAWAKETGYGMTYKCPTCEKMFTSKHTICPHCGAPQSFK